MTRCERLAEQALLDLIATGLPKIRELVTILNACGNDPGIQFMRHGAVRFRDQHFVNVVPGIPNEKIIERQRSERQLCRLVELRVVYAKVVVARETPISLRARNRSLLS